MTLPESFVIGPESISEFFDTQNGAETAVLQQTAVIQQTDIGSRLAQIEARMAELMDLGVFRNSPAVSRVGKPDIITTAPATPDLSGAFLNKSNTDGFPFKDDKSVTVTVVEDVQSVKTDTISIPSKDVTAQVMSIIQEYGQNEANAEGAAWLGRINFEPRVRRQVQAGIPVELCLPAFPWKSVNKVEKVLGAIPDLGEVLGLGRLQALCEDIEEVHSPGAYVTITSDGLVYNDLLGISDEEVYEYGLSLRHMAVDKGYDRLKFIYIMNLLGLTDNTQLSKEEYLATVGGSREMLMEKYLPPGFNVYDAILTDTDIKLTYCGYLIFLAKDLRYSPVVAGVTGKNEYRRLVKRVAQDMITRGKAFAAVIEDVLPEHVRLSIHRSTGLSKLAFPLVPQPNHFSMTPWHCSIAVTADGRFRTAHASEMRDKYDLIKEGDQPYYFRERSSLWEWDVPVKFEFFYPRGIRVKAVQTGAACPELGPSEFAKVKALSKVFKTVIVTGFGSSESAANDS